MSRSAGTCMTMGTASTMASLVEAMGVALPENAAIPAVDSRRNTLAHLTGRRIVGLVKEDVRLSHILTRAAFENAIVTNAAIGGSTNAVVHLIAIAGRLGVPLTLADWDRLGRDVPCLAQPRAVGQVPHGGLLLRGRAAGAAARARAALAQGRAHRERADAVGERRGRAVLEPRRDLPARAAVQGRKAASPCSRATSRRRARCSSRRRRRPRS